MGAREHGNRRAWLCCLWAVLMAIALTACLETPEVKGTALSLPRPATPFELENQLGQSISLADHEGKVVLLTFLYTRCPDVCPLVTSQLRDTYQILGSDANDVAFIAVSVDPERDTVEAAYEFSERWGMTASWDFLVGDRNELSGVWSAYYIDPSTSSDSHEGEDGTPGQHAVQKGPPNGLIEDVYGELSGDPLDSGVSDRRGRHRSYRFHAPVRAGGHRPRHPGTASVRRWWA